MNNIVTIPSSKWHKMCYDLKLDEHGGANDRKVAFEECFNCSVSWKSRLDEWGGDPDTRPEPVMILTFANPNDAVMFALKWLS